MEDKRNRNHSPEARCCRLKWLENLDLPTHRRSDEKRVNADTSFNVSSSALCCTQRNRLWDTVATDFVLLTWRIKGSGNEISVHIQLLFVTENRKNRVKTSGKWRTIRLSWYGNTDSPVLQSFLPILIAFIYLMGRVEMRWQRHWFSCINLVWYPHSSVVSEWRVEKQRFLIVAMHDVAASLQLPEFISFLSFLYNLNFEAAVEFKQRLP